MLVVYGAVFFADSIIFFIYISNSQNQKKRMMMIKFK
jgi:hypothetical protein